MGMFCGKNSGLVLEAIVAVPREIGRMRPKGRGCLVLVTPAPARSTCRTRRVRRGKPTSECTLQIDLWFKTSPDTVVAGTRYRHLLRGLLQNLHRLGMSFPFTRAAVRRFADRWCR